MRQPQAARIEIPSGADAQTRALVASLQAALDQALARLEERTDRRIAALGRVPAGKQVQTTDFSPRPGQLVTVEAPPTGLVVLLPAARPQLSRARISISSRNTNPVRWEAVRGLVNGVRMVTSNAVGLVEAICDGSSWHVSQGAASTTGSVASTAGATYFLETADTGLPNARVAADSSSIDVDLTTPGAVSWKPVSGFFTWAYVLGEGAHSGAHTPIIDSGQALNFASGATGVTADGDLTVDAAGVFEVDCTDMHLHPTGALHLGHEAQTASIHQGCVGTWEGVAGDFSLSSGADAAFSSANSHKVSTGAVLRLEIDNTGAWNLAGDPGSAGQFLRSFGAGSAPTWHTFELLDLPNQDPDTFLGNVGTVSSTPVAVALSSLAGSGLAFGSHALSVDASVLAGGGLVGFGSVLAVVAGDGIDVAADSVSVDVSDFAGSGLEDDGSNNLRIAAAAAGAGLTGGGGTALAVGSSTSIVVNANDVQRAALTGEVTASANVNSTTVTRSTNFQSSPWTGQHQHNANVYYSGAFVGFDAKATVDAMSTGDIRKGGGLTIASNASIAVNAGTGFIVAGSGGGTAQGWLRINEGVSPPLGGLASYEGMYWVRGSSSLENIPMYTDSSNVDHELAYTLDDDDKDARSMSRVVFWDDFLTGFGVTAPIAGNTYFYSDTTWMCEAGGSSGSVAIKDEGASGASLSIGRIDVTTGATSGSSVVLYKGSAATTRWIRADQVSSFKVRAGLSSASNVAFALGLSSTVYGGAEAAYVYFDTSLDTTVHAFSADTAGATSNDTDTNIAPGTTTRVYEIRKSKSSALDWEFYIDGVLKATQTMSTKARAMNIHLLVITRTNSARTLTVDYVKLDGVEVARS